MRRIDRNLSALRAAFPHTLPVMGGYLFLGMAFGVLLQSKGYGVMWAALMSAIVYAGSMQFVAAGLLAGGFHPLQAALITLMVNARHIFYGISMLDKFSEFKRVKPYMIFSLTDETFSLLYSAKPPEGVSGNRFCFFIALLDHCYWVAGSVAGSLLGAALPFDAAGVDFVMTALFTVIFLEQLLQRGGRLPAVIGLSGSLLCLIIFGRDWFIIPSMAVLAATLVAARGPLERSEETE